jgi:Tol biopolymer transport system component
VTQNHGIGWLAGCALLYASVAVAAEMEAGVTLALPDAAAISRTAAAVADQFEVIEPEFVRALTSFESGRNDSNPVWAPSGKLIAFERSRGDKREIVISHTDGKLMQTIYFQLSGAEQDSKEAQFFLPGLAEDPSYNSGVTWARDSNRLAFMSNGGEGNYDVYSQLLGGVAQRLTEHKEKDGLADWAATSNQIVFVSGRSGKGDVYLLDPLTRAVTQLTSGDKPYLYPRWSPDGKKIAMIYGSTENHDIYVMDDTKKPVESMRALTRWQYDDLRPTWSPDGKKIAFYTNHNAVAEQKKWSLAVIAVDGSDGVDGPGLEKRIVATDVIPDIEQGPAWLADGSGLIYVKDDELEYNPIYLVHLASMQSQRLKTETKMNHDIACGPDGLLAFRAQQDQWDQIFIARLKPK